MLKVYRNCRVESAGEKILWFRFLKSDLGITFYNWRPTFWLFLHGPLAYPEPIAVKAEPYEIISCKRDHSKFNADTFNYCPRCDSGRIFRPSDENMGLRHCWDCDLVFDLKNFLRVQ
jgi:hypothetical protein